jgi:hypothetical protein
LHLDPRIKPSVALTQVVTLTKELEANATAAYDDYQAARALSAKLDGFSGAGIAEFKAAVDSLAPAAAGGGGGGRGGRGGGGGGGGGRGGRGGGPVAATTLPAVWAASITAANAFSSAEVGPTATRLDAANQAKTDAATVMKRWTTLSTTGLTALNAKRKAAGLPTIPR